MYGKTIKNPERDGIKMKTFEEKLNGIKKAHFEEIEEKYNPLIEIYRRFIDKSSKLLLKEIAETDIRGWVWDHEELQGNAEKPPKKYSRAWFIDKFKTQKPFNLFGELRLIVNFEVKIVYPAPSRIYLELDDGTEMNFSLPE